MLFKLHAPFKPTGDQPQAINALTSGLQHGVKHQVLLGVTGCGKTFTLANVIERLKRPTLVISHNKTLAAQLYQEFRDFFPTSAVSYFVSYYDFYQPEAYIPQTDTYIEKETEINEEIDKLRLAATTNLLTRRDTIIVASVSCIYNIGSPKEYGKFVLELRRGVKLSQTAIITRLVDLQYINSKFEFKRGTFRIRGDTIDIFPAYEDTALRIVFANDIISRLSKIDPTSGEEQETLTTTVVYPRKHYMTDRSNLESTFAEIRYDLEKRTKELRRLKKPLEAHRLNQRVNFDLEMIQEVGYVNGIENYSRYFDGRIPGEAPYTLLDYYNEPYKKDWLLIIDESHMTIPQIRGMYNGDRSRKQTLIDFGFRLPAALDNRPLTFLEFMQRIPQIIYVSATPDEWELSLAQQHKAKKIKQRTTTRQGDSGVVEQLIRPTGIVDPEIVIRPTKGQIIDLSKEIIARKAKNERVLVTTLTKRMAEDLAQFLTERKYLTDPQFIRLKMKNLPQVHYLHSDIVTLKRSDILDDLRSGKYDVIVGINLLREGLDLPEVSLVAILDADKEGFLRSETSLIQTMGRAARHIKGFVIMYADTITSSMKRAIAEIDRRRKIQLKYNRRHHLTPQRIVKPIRGKLVVAETNNNLDFLTRLDNKQKGQYKELLSIDTTALTPHDTVKLIKKLEGEMRWAANNLNFELAAEIRNKIEELKYAG